MYQAILGETRQGNTKTKTCKKEEDRPTDGKVPHLENTYIVGPRPHERFKQQDIKQAMTKVLESRLVGKKYDSEEMAEISKEICTEIKEKVKELGHPRHKLVVQVTIGEVQGQGVRLSSRCLWDTEADNFASVVFQAADIYCCAMVFGCYFD